MKLGVLRVPCLYSSVLSSLQWLFSKATELYLSSFCGYLSSVLCGILVELSLKSWKYPWKSLKLFATLALVLSLCQHSSLCFTGCTLLPLSLSPLPPVCQVVRLRLLQVYRKISCSFYLLLFLCIFVTINFLVGSFVYLYLLMFFLWQRIRREGLRKE